MSQWVGKNKTKTWQERVEKPGKPWKETRDCGRDPCRLFSHSFFQNFHHFPFPSQIPISRSYVPQTSSAFNVTDDCFDGQEHQRQEKLL